MKNTLSLSACALVFATSTWAAPQELKQPSPEEAALIEQAAPSKAAAVPKKARKVLVVNQCEGFVHSSIPYGAQAFEILGRKTGAFSTVVVNDLSILEQPEFDTFDAIIMNNTTLRLPLLADADETREARAEKRFVDFVRNGKGLVGVHAATDCLYKWPVYGEMMGGYFNGHPWNEDVRVRLEDPAHPLLAGFKGLDFTVADEIYEFRDYSRDALRVLMSLDVKKTDMSKDKIKRTDGDFAVAWIREFGKGRVFYFSLGHRHEIFWTAPILKCYLDGIQYALGDLPADAKPSARLTEKELQASREAAFGPSMENMLAELATYTLGVNDSVAKQVDAFVDEHLRDTQANRETLSKGLAKVAANPQAAPDGRALACRKLSLVGADNAVPALAKLIDDPALGNWACYALARMPGKAADEALADALTRAKGKDRLAVAALVGARRVSASVPALAGMAAAGSGDTVAAAEALGQIGGKEAVKALIPLQGRAKGPVREAIDRALLACADGDRKEGRTSEAANVYALLSGPETAEHIRASAFYGKNLSAGSAGADEAVSALKGANAEFAWAASRLLRDMTDKAAVAAAASALPEMPQANRIIALAALAARGDRTALEGVLKQVASESEDVRLAALQAMESLGDKRAVKAVMKVAAASEMDKPSRKAASKALSTMNGPGVDKEMLAEMRAADVLVKTEYAKAFGARKTRSALADLLAAARDADSTLAGEARGAISLIAQAEDLPEIVALLIDTPDAAGLRELERILVKVAKTADDEKLKTGAVLKGLKRDISTNARGALLMALGKMEAPSSLPVLLAASKESDPVVRRSAIRAIADNWPDAEPLQALRDASRNDSDEECRVLALSGYARMLTMPSALPVKDKLKLYREALDLAKGTKEKRVLIEGLGALIHKDALAFVMPFMKDSSVSKDAFQAALKISEGLNGGAMVLTGSVRGEERYAIDNVLKTRWTTGASKKGGEWFVIDLGYEDDIRTIFLDAEGSGGDQPSGYEIYVSLDGKTWGAPVQKGVNPKKRLLTIELPPTYGRFVKIVQTGVDGSFWSINELQVNGVPDHKVYPPLDRTGWKVTAFNGDKNQDPKNAIDGDLTKRWGTGSAMKSGDWFAVDLGKAHTVHGIVMDAAKSGGDYPREFQIFTSMDGTNWYGPVGMGKGTGAVTTASILPTQARHVKIVQTGSTEFNWWSIYDLQVLGE